MELEFIDRMIEDEFPFDGYTKYREVLRELTSLSKEYIQRIHERIRCIDAVVELIYWYRVLDFLQGNRVMEIQRELLLVKLRVKQELLTNIQESSLENILKVYTFYLKLEAKDDELKRIIKQLISISLLTKYEQCDLEIMPELMEEFNIDSKGYLNKLKNLKNIAKDNENHYRLKEKRKNLITRKQQLKFDPSPLYINGKQNITIWKCHALINSTRE